MTVQGFNIVAYVRQHEGVSPVELAEVFGVSQRTMRDYIRRANEALDGAARISFSRSHNGYVCEVIDEPVLESWIARAREVVAGDPASSTSARVTYLLNDLLQRNDWITLDELAGMLFVSRASISGDLKRIEPTLAKYGLQLEKRPRYGIRVTGPEMSRRLCLAEGVARGLAADEQEADAFERELEPLLQAVSTAVERVIEAEDFVINSLAYQNLLVHLGIALMRIQGENYMPAAAVQASDVAGTREYDVAHKIADAIHADLGIELPKTEVAYIAIHLAGKRVLDAAGASPNSLTITDAAWNVVDRMLEAVWRSFRFDFRDDFELRMNLARHLMPLSVRLTYHLHLNNPLLADIKRRYPLAYSMALDAASVLAEEYGSFPSEDETGYIALAFALALERQKTGGPKRNLLVVCASGAGSAHLLAYKIQQEFGERLGAITTCNVSQIPTYDFTDIDYVATTVPLPIQPPVPVREVTLFLDDRDRDSLRNLLEAAHAPHMEMVLPRGLFFAHQRFATKQEAIAFLCERARAYGDLPETLERLVWEREEAAPTAFGNNVALPHPIEAVSDATFMAVALLDEPLDWGNQQVQAIFLVLVSRTAGRELDMFYRSVARVLNDADAIRTLIAHQDFDRLMDELAEEE